MDRSVAPGEDFYRYASGGWLDRVSRPEDMADWDILSIMGERVVRQVSAIAAEAGSGAASAPEGSPVQLVGSFYNAFMDVAAIEERGLAPLQDILGAIDAIVTFDDMTRFMAAQALTGGPGLFNIIGPSPDPADSSRYALYVAGQEFGLATIVLPVLALPEDDSRKQAYRRYVEDTMAIAGHDAAEAERIAALVLRIETALYSGMLSPAEGNDPRLRYGKLDFDEVQAMIPALDIGLYLDEIGFARPEFLVMYEPRALGALAELWQTAPMADLKDYARFRVVAKFSAFLDPAFRDPGLALSRALVGTARDRPRDEQVPGLLSEYLGHPSSRLYVDAFFPEAARAEMAEIIRRVHEEFGKRIETLDWLTAATRDEALEKHGKMVFAVGYPDSWIDFSQVAIGAESVANIRALAAFDLERTLGKMGHPVATDEFASRTTLPTAVNAAYQPAANRFEVTAAITQQPVFSTEMDPALKFCRLGAVAGHEMTHGFDSGGRQYDAAGNFRDWWTAGDAAAFEAEASKLIDQAEAFEALPGLFLNGPQTVRENMADVGGITLAHLALRTWLAEHPEQDVEIDGLTQDQRCFVAWAQFWTGKSSEDYIRTKVAADYHPPGFYRAVAPLRHVDAFYEAFGIGEQDPVWLPPGRRVRAW
ncbi:M13 family metallopeptidase [Poseidonocella sp. HB161398]|uniref:M13 family metallopeptidase n=1 Tax=Poseidonocella sp. HB161398 TaxID=2320855 RepID=UPI001F0E2452|nr:M13 family metallopeptidase [Poseidonocella sp. HB161398]